MRFLLVSARKDVQRMLTDPLALALWIGIPLMIGLLMAAATGVGDGSGPKVRVLLVDEDDTLLTRLGGALGGGGGGAGGVAQLFEIEAVSAAEGRRRIDAGDGSALVTLPEGFSLALLEEQPTRLEVVTNPAQRILPEILIETLELLVESTFYAHRLIGEPVRGFVDEIDDVEDFPPDAAVAELSGTINARMREIEPMLFPPVLQLEQVKGPEQVDEEPFNFGLMLLPGIVFMALLFIAQGASDDLWKEKDQGTLLRVLTTPHGLLAFLGGKLLSAGLVMAVVAAVGLLAVGVTQYDLDLSRALIGVPWCAFAGTALFGLFLLVQVFATSQRGGNVLGSVFLFPLMMLGGSFFPFEAMPDWMVAVGRLTPNGRALIELQALLDGELDMQSFALSVTVLGGVALVSLTLCASRIRRRFAMA